MCRLAHRETFITCLDERVKKESRERVQFNCTPCRENMCHGNRRLEFAARDGNAGGYSCDLIETEGMEDRDPHRAFRTAPVSLGCIIEGKSDSSFSSRILATDTVRIAQTGSRVAFLAVVSAVST